MDTRCGQSSTELEQIPFTVLAPVCGRHRAHRRSQKQRLRVSVFLGCHLLKIMPAMTPGPVSDDRESNEQACHVLSTVVVGLGMLLFLLVRLLALRGKFLE